MSKESLLDSEFPGNGYFDLQKLHNTPYEKNKWVGIKMREL
jgi:hypothetical protein